MGYRWCPDCRKQVQQVPEPVWVACGLPQRLAGLCLDCKAAVPPDRMMRSWLVFDGPMRHALHSLKYRRNIARGDIPAHHLVEFVTALVWPGYVVVPIPVVKNRMKERGYNQEGLAAIPLASIRHRRYMPRALVRYHGTRIWVGLTAIQHRENVRDAFIAQARLVRGKNIRSLDDGATTVATLAQGAATLIAAGAKPVYGQTLAPALERQGLQMHERNPYLTGGTYGSRSVDKCTEPGTG